ncbi:Uncharacterised protein [Raoultella planticola]|uniref:Uncharacterized protein n=1 Tax=Raoultella planticola TaxID=575 RepID=A0A485BZ70_RAOPL|nr:Uncharacterised protein [Raoultella planticola]
MNAGRGPRSERYRAADFATKLADRQHRRADRSFNIVTVSQQSHTGRRRFNPPSGPLNQPGLQKLFQLTDLQTDRGLR